MLRITYQPDNNNIELVNILIELYDSQNFKQYRVAEKVEYHNKSKKSDQLLEKIRKQLEIAVEEIRNCLHHKTYDLVWDDGNNYHVANLKFSENVLNLLHVSTTSYTTHIIITELNELKARKFVEEYLLKLISELDNKIDMLV